MTWRFVSSWGQILSKLKNVANKDNIGFYRDDGLGTFQNISKTEIERKKNQIAKVFKDCRLSIIIKRNLKSVDFLDVTFDLANYIYKPYRISINKPLHINKNFNHPPNILKKFPKSIEKRISESSSTDQLKSTMMHCMKAILKNHYNLKTIECIKYLTKTLQMLVTVV